MGKSMSKYFETFVKKQFIVKISSERRGGGKTAVHTRYTFELDYSHSSWHFPIIRFLSCFL